MNTNLIHGDMTIELPKLPADHFDSCVTDPPYELGFMGKGWDNAGVSFQASTWRHVYRVIKPGAHLLCFGGTRTFHRIACAIEDAGFEIRDCIMYVYGTGFPKSHDVSKAIDKAAGAEREVVGEKGGRYATPKQDFRGGSHHAGSDTQKTAIFNSITAPATPEAQQWSGWGTALKPAWEPIIVARKPLIGTVAENVLKHGTGGLNVDACRVPGEPWKAHDATGLASVKFFTNGDAPIVHKEPHDAGRWPANLIHDGSEEVLAGFPHSKDGVAGKRSGVAHVTLHGLGARDEAWGGYGSSGSAARFFYCAKASKSDRGTGNTHPTVKPTALMQYLCRLVTQPGGTILDPFMGSGTTGKASIAEGFNFTGIELNDTPEHPYFTIAKSRILNT